MPRWILLLLTVPPWISLAGAWLATGCGESPTTYRGDAAPHVAEFGGCDLTDAGVEELLVRLDRPFANDTHLFTAADLRSLIDGPSTSL